MPAEKPHRVVGEHAVGPSAVGDHVGIGGQLTDPVGQLFDRDVDRVGQMATKSAECSFSGQLTDAASQTRSAVLSPYRRSS